MSDANVQLFEMLGQLLGQLVSQDNQERQAAEEQLNQHWLANQPGPLLAGLSHLAANHQDPSLRSFAAVLLRRFAGKTGGNPGDVCLLQSAGPEVLLFVQQQLLQSLAQEQTLSVRTKVADSAAQVASLLLQNRAQWPELLQACTEFIQSPTPVLRQTTFIVFSRAPALIAKQDPSQVKLIFSQGLQDQDIDVRFAALKASVDYMCLVKPRKDFNELLPLILGVFSS